MSTPYFNVAVGRKLSDQWSGSPTFTTEQQALADELLQSIQPGRDHVPDGTFVVYPMRKDVLFVWCQNQQLWAFLLPMKYYHFIPDPFYWLRTLQVKLPSSLDSDLELQFPVDPPSRTVGQLRSLMEKYDNGILLGSCQAVVDGARIVFRRESPPMELFEAIWQFLPYSTQRTVKVTTFTADVNPTFEMQSIPGAIDPHWWGYVGESKLLNYPEGRYEYHLQVTIDMQDQVEMERMFQRKSSSEIVKLILVMLVLGIIVAFLLTSG